MDPKQEQGQVSPGEADTSAGVVAGDAITGPTDEQLRAQYEAGGLLTKERHEELFRDRWNREKDKREREAKDAAEAAREGARKKALKDQEDFKALSETQAADIATRDARIEELKGSEARVAILEQRLEAVTNARMEGLAKPYRELVSKMPVEERADWLEANAELLAASLGKPAGSPPSPAPARRNGHKQDEESDKRAREEMKRTSRI